MRIQVIEDDRKIASFLERGLREEGYAVDVAHDGNEGATNAHVYDYDLLIVDIMLPGKNGYEVCAFVRQHASLAATPVLLLVGAFEVFDEREAARVGASGRITKPFEPKQLAETVAALVGEASPEVGTRSGPEGPPPHRSCRNSGSFHAACCRAVASMSCPMGSSPSASRPVKLCCCFAGSGW